MAQQSIRPYLDYQSDRVEAVLAAHRAPARVTGGTVGPRLIKLFLSPAPTTRFAAIRRLADDLALALHVPSLAVNRSQRGVTLAFPNPHPSSLPFLPLLQRAAPLPAASPLLGLTDDGLPLIARLPSPDVAHVLIVGTTGSGKSVLLRTIAASLILANPASAVRLLCIDPKLRTFTPFSKAAHLASAPIADPVAAHHALVDLLRTMELRDRHHIAPASDPAAPFIIVLIDELADLLAAAPPSTAQTLVRLAQRGRQAGIHLIVATQHPSAAVLSSLLRANFPLRLVGRVASAQDAALAAGRANSNAHLLSGHGDFLAFSSQPTLRFLVPFIPERHIPKILNASLPGRSA